MECQLTLCSAAIEEDYARRLNKLSKTSLGSTEIGQLKESLDNLLAETAQQASFHEDLVSELRGKDVEQQTVEFASRLNNMKKGLQASVEKSFRNKGLQEGHVDKVYLARRRWCELTLGRQGNGTSRIASSSIRTMPTRRSRREGRGRSCWRR